MQIHHPKKCFTKELEHPDSALVDWRTNNAFHILGRYWLIFNDCKCINVDLVPLHDYPNNEVDDNSNDKGEKEQTVKSIE
jgi:hypothetical protein